MITISLGLLGAAWMIWHARGFRKIAAFLSIFVLVGVWMMHIGAKDVMRSLQARSWPVVQGTVLSSRVVSRTDEDGTVYAPEVVYAYRYRGLSYRGSRIWMRKVWSSSSWAGSIVQRYPPGSSVRVYVQPQNPAYALLEPGLHLSVFLPGMVGLIFIGLALFFYVLLLKGQQVSEEKHTSSTIRFNTSPETFLLGFGLIWLLMTLPMQMELYRMIRQGTWGVQVWVFLMFTLVGVFLIAAGISTMIQKKPLQKTRIQVEGQDVRVGETVCFRILHLPASFSRVYVTLKCVEVEEWRSGEDTSRNEKVLWTGERLLLPSQTMRSPGGRFARVCLEIPPGLPPTQSATRVKGSSTLPSFVPDEARDVLQSFAKNATYRSVYWTLEIHVDRKGPDAHALTVLQVLPPVDNGADEKKPETGEDLPAAAPLAFVSPLPDGWIWRPHRYRALKGGMFAWLGALISTTVGGVGSLALWHEKGLDRILILLTGFFFLLGVYLVFHGLYLMLGGIQVRRRGPEVEILWRFAGIPVRKKIFRLSRVHDVRLVPPRSSDWFVVEVQFREGERLRWGASFSKAETQELVGVLKREIRGDAL